MTGKTIGTYKILGSLGSGGFGDVWKCMAPDGSQVAIKALNPRHLHHDYADSIIKKFFKEAMILARLDHPHITKLIEFFPIEDNNYAIAMEYVEGVTLRDLLLSFSAPQPDIRGMEETITALEADSPTVLDSPGEDNKAHQTQDAGTGRGVMPRAMAMKIARQILDALNYAHSEGIVHRDIKAGNIMVDHLGQVKIMDFGIAAISDAPTQETQTSQRMFSIHYTAPERFENKKIDHRADIYSLGILFYEMFAGRKPFDSESSQAIMRQHIEARPAPPARHARDIPEALNRSILKALEKRPKDRFQSCLEFREALEKEISVSSKKKWLMAGAALLLPFLAWMAITFVQVNKKNPPPKNIAPENGLFTPAGVNEKGIPEFTHNRTGRVAALIPAGEFVMGSNRYASERPERKAKTGPYYIDRRPVTNRRFKKFVTENGHRTEAEKKGYGYVRTLSREWKKIQTARWDRPLGKNSAEDRLPVVQVSYHDALTYCRWAGGDLPTEAQWEKAARGTSGRAFPWGDHAPDETLARFGHPESALPAPVDPYEKGQSPYGALGMAGNVYQWCKDARAGEEGMAVLKGGSFIEGPESLRAANREKHPPDFQSNLFGFRCVYRDERSE
jgi:eukaryotic-like serine/threonine-protein kinase